MTTGPDHSQLPAILGGDPLFGRPPRWPPNDPEIASVFHQMVADGSWGRYFGPHCEQLIQRLQEIYDCEHVLLCSSGRMAVELALRGLDVAPDGEVALSAYDFHSSFDGIHQSGAMPLLVDVRFADAQMDVPALERSLTPVTTAVIASHLHGGLVDMPALRNVAAERGLPIIEDACQASGARISGRLAGRWGDVGVLSFGGSKLLTAGRGGALLTDRADVIQRIRRSLRGDNHSCTLSEMQAAVLLPQLTNLPQQHQRRLDSVQQIDAALAGVTGLRRFDLPSGDMSPAFYKVGFHYDADAFGKLSRAALVSALRAEGLAVDEGLPALHTYHSRRRFRTVSHLPSATAAGETVVCLHHPVLLDESVDWSRWNRALRRIRDNVDMLQALE